MNKKYINGLLIAMLALSGCTKLDETLRGQVGDTGSTAAVDPAASLNSAYSAVYEPFCAPWAMWSLQEFTSDEAIVPTRAGDWDDNGAWRALFLHAWKPDHVRVSAAFQALGSLSYKATDLLNYKPSAQQEAEARFLRAFAEYHLLDGWGQVPFRDPGEKLNLHPRVRKAADEITYLLTELDAITSKLPNGEAYKASQNAAKVLKMKVLLNKGAYLNRQTPTFDNTDMQKVVDLANEIINSGKYALQSKYFENFAPNNGEISKEIIFSSQNTPGQSSPADITHFNFATCHYNMQPSGWNGFSTLSNFYGKFEANDQRIGGSYTGLTNVIGLRVGFLVGQQYAIVDGASVALKDRKGNPLIFDPNLSIIEKDPNHLERAGIRVIKYVYDQANKASSNTADNDYVHFRYADVLLMKAEAMMRMGNTAGALLIVNEIRAKRGASLMTALTPATFLDELGREFYWEGHRRTDLIRFGKFLEPWQEKPTDDPKYLLFPIPQTQLSNPNYVQNTGY